MREQDPTLIRLRVGNTETEVTPIRVVSVIRGPISYVNGGPGLPTLVYAVYGSQSLNAFVVTPLGFVVYARPLQSLQPSFAVDTGVIFSAPDLPVDRSSRVNYSFSFGPGIRYSFSQTFSLDAAYMYRHISNASTGQTNPGIDQLVLRLGVCKHFRE